MLTVVAEKLHAICLLGLANTRLKDYFDLWVQLVEETFDPAKLRGAVEATFARRQLAIPADVPTGLTDAFAQDTTKQRPSLAVKLHRLPHLRHFNVDSAALQG
jgi:hypothetical protein